MGFDKKMVKKAVSKSGHVFNIWNLKCSINQKVGDLKAEVIKSAEPIKWDDLDKSAFKPIRQWQAWGKRKEYADSFDCAWFHFTGQVPKKAKGKSVILRIKLQGEGLVFNPDGIVLQGITQILSKGDVFHSLIAKQRIDITECSTGDENIDLYVDAGFNGKFRFKKCTAHLRRADICIHDEEINQYYYDYIDLFFIMMILDKKSPRFIEIDKALKQSYKIYKKKGAKYAREFLKPTIEKKPEYEATTYYCIGHAHIDLAWLWPLRETKRKVARTFANQLRNLAIYDGYYFAESQPQMFVWLKEEYPELFERVKKYVLDGRIELQGGMWVESDCNLSGGESWVRQCLYGQKFWKDEFDFKSRMCWLPDVFGFPASLPQVIKKSGMDYFMTIKPTSNDFNRFPYRTFNWVGIDGTSLLSHMEPLGDYNAGNSPLAIKKSEDRYSEKEICNKALLIYGDGDGGGGPGEGHMEYMMRHQKNIDGLAPCKPSPAVNFFDDIKDMASVLPTHTGELYYERHQGCYTSQANAKKWNRRIEELLHKIEWLGAVAFLKGVTYDRAKVEEIWKEVLLYQFHDILPGSSIKRVYDESYARYQIMYSELQEIEKTMLDALSQEGEKSAVNSVDFDRKEFVKVDDEWYTADLKAHSVGKLTPANIDVSELSYTDTTIENANLKVTFGDNGEITSLIDKNENKELVKEYFNKLVVYSDPFRYYNAWDIQWGKDEKTNYMMMKKSTFKLTSSNTYIEGAYLVRENSYKYNKSSLVQKVYVEVGGDMVRFDTTVDWNEELKMLRADFVPTVFADNVKCNIQFGNFDRTTSEADKDEDYNPNWAQFEVCAHKFVNLDGEDYGLALLNNGKYGHRAKEGFLSLALLRAPIFPDPTCDRGNHTFSYAIYPHKAKFEDTDLMAKGYCFNNPIEIVNNDLALDTIAKFDNKNIVIETIKVAEDNEGIIVRAYECYGETAKATLALSFDSANIYECDMLENKEKLARSKNFEFSPYEIKTLYIAK
ncbi:MAG: alpha-mannosidase [Clostridiales bacterium]|nr:alpha-mannosidase [Clostridiales bacterium]